MRRIVTVTLLGLAVMSGCASEPVAAPAAVTVTAPAPPAVTETVATTSTAVTTVLKAETVEVEVTKTQKAVTVTPEAETVVKTVLKTKEVTVTAEPPGPATDAQDGSYLVGIDLAVGTYHCGTADGDTFWRISDNTGDTIENGFGATAFITADAFTADLKRCPGGWVKIA